MGVCLVVALAISGVQQANPGTSTGDLAPATLQALRGHYRPLLVFSPDAGNPAYLEQIRLLTEQAASLAEREIMVVPIVARIDGHLQDNQPEKQFFML